MNASILVRGLAPIALALACALSAPAHAQDAAARQKELEQARAELQAAARRVAELSGAGGERIRSIHLAPLPDEPGKARLGVLLGIDDQAGVRIAGVTPGGGAEKAGLKAGDRLLRIRGKAIAGGSGEDRVAQARRALADLEPGKPVQVTYQRDGRQREAAVTPAAAQRLVFAHTFPGGDDAGVTALLDGDELARLGQLGPQLRGELLRLSRAGACKDGEDCTVPLLSEALRWDGLKLLSLEPQLGRYFGTDRGVLVLAQGALPGLQAGDVIQKIEGKPVASPREAMQAMNAKQPGAQAKVSVLRDRSPREVRVTVPERTRSLEFFPAPPAPPAPPAAPVPPLPPPAPAARAGTALL